MITMHWHSLNGSQQTRYLDEKVGDIYAAFVHCESGRVRLMTRRLKKVRCGGITFPSFKAAQRLS